MSDGHDMRALDLPVLGLGLISPAGLRPADHVFFLRAGSAVATDRAFVDREDKPVAATHCPWLDPRMPLPRPMATLLRSAIDGALGDASLLPAERRPKRDVPVVLTLPSSYEAFTDADAARVLGLLSDQTGYVIADRRPTGAAGFFDGLIHAAELLETGASAVVVAAVDSFANAGAIECRLEASSPWEKAPLTLSEAAAALVVGAAVPGGRHAGRIRFAGTAPSVSTDDNQEPADGRALTELVRAALGLTQGRVRHGFGQRSVTALRTREWGYAVTRNSTRFADEFEDHVPESRIGEVGAAAGAVQATLSLASARHGVLGDAAGPMLAWAISRDGTRGLALLGAAP